VSEAKLLSTIKATFANETTERLADIWATNDREAYSAEAFTAVRELLTERGVTPPVRQEQPPPIPAVKSGLVSKGFLLVGVALVGGWTYSILSPRVPEFLDSYILVMLFAVSAWGLGSILVGAISILVDAIKKIRRRKRNASQ
jgi:hypothetical protein